MITKTDTGYEVKYEFRDGKKVHLNTHSYEGAVAALAYFEYTDEFPIKTIDMEWLDNRTKQLEAEYGEIKC